MPKIKVQITLPEEVYEEVKKDIEKNYMTASSWFLKATLAELDRLKQPGRKKTIELNI
jgi:hypothetical protein